MNDAPPTLHRKKPPEGGLSSNATALEPEGNETTNASQPSLRTEQEEIKHTPRPWYRGEIEIDSGGKAIGSAYILSAEQRGSTLANARLMAAAPDLLEALKYARATFGDPANQCAISSIHVRL